MVRVNENYLKIQSSYLFTEIAHRVKAYQEKNPSAKIIRLGIGDVTRVCHFIDSIRRSAHK